MNYISLNYERLLKVAIFSALGVCAGFLNGFLGSGGGIILVFAMASFSAESDTKERFATAVASVLPMSVVSVIFYMKSEAFSFSDASGFLIPAALGGIFGAFIMDKISPSFLKFIFASLMIFAGFRMI